jgi:flavin-dependent dehydrogenase
LRENDYDAVIVGARCAGATLATFLARAGARVLLLDKDVMPSDHVLSTHFISPPGMDVLDEAGVGEAVRSLAPRICVIRIEVDGKHLDLKLPEHRGGYCPRRKRLDGLLQQAADKAGARFLDRSRVVSLIQRDGRVRGVRAIIGDRERVITAGLVVGADGRRSTVAGLVGAEEYLDYDAPRATYWGYWNAPSLWKTDSGYPFDAYFGLDGPEIRVVFPTDQDQLLIAGSPLTDQVGMWRANPRRALRAALDSDPITAALVRDSQPAGKICGTAKERFFFRRAAGSGWALVGDAGHHKEFLLGDGITEALIQARSLAVAIENGSDVALARWWRARDVEALPLYFLGRIAAAPERPVELQRVLFSRLPQQPALMAQMAAVADQRLSPFAALPAPQVLSWIAAAAMRGRWSIIGETMGMGRHVFALDREMRARCELLAETGARSPLTGKAA